MSIHTYSFSPNKHFICFTTFRLYVEVHFYTADGPGPCHRPLVPGGLVARIRHSHCCSLTSISGQEPKSCFKPLQAEATLDHPENTSLTTLGEFRSFEFELPTLLAGSPAINTDFPSPQPDFSNLALLCSGQQDPSSVR